MTILPPAHVVDIVGLDYAFQAPSTLPAGRTTFRFVNRGKVAHELNVSLLKRGVSVQQFMAAINADTPVAPFRDAPVGVVFARPGERAAAALSTELLPGRTYVVMCIKQDTPKAKLHSAMGMYSAFTVSRAPVVPPVVPTGMSPVTIKRPRPEPADTIVATDYAFIRAPRTLAPGHHRFAFANRGSFRHEVNMFVLKPGVTLLRAMDVQKAGGDVDALIESPIGVLHSPAGSAPLGVLEVDMLPGRDYTMICTFSNDAKSPSHAMLGMLGSIHVTGSRTP